MYNGKKLSDLHKLEHELRLALRSCKRELRKREAHCPILREKNSRKPENENVRVEFLYVSAGPFHPAAVKLVREVLAAEVRDERMACRLKFLGSPTIRINGRDVTGESSTAKKFGLSVRLYPGSEQIGLPPAEVIHRAVLEAQGGGQQ